MPDTSLSSAEAAHSLGVHITKGKDLVRLRVVPEGKETAWSTAAELLLTQIFGEDSPSLKGFKEAKPRHALSEFQNPDAMAKHRKQTVLNRIEVLMSLMDLLGTNAERERQSEGKPVGKGKQPKNAGLTVSAQAIAPRLRQHIEKGKAKILGPISPAEEQAWNTATQHLLMQAFGEASYCVSDVMDVNQYKYAFGGATDEQLAALRIDSMRERITIMEGLAELLEAQAEGDAPAPRVVPVPVATESIATNEIVLTWSGRTSHAFASLLYEWLPRVVPGVKTWISSEDIAKGDRWFPELMSQLEKTTTCVVSVTRENHNAPWVYYEAGVIAAKQQRGKICTVLFGVTTKSIKDTPLAQFQATETDKDDMWRLIKAVNGRLPSGPNDEQALRSQFDEHWPMFERHTEEALAHSLVPVESADTLDLPSQYQLGDEAKEMLREACKDADGRILFIQHDAGLEFQINGRTFVNDGSGRDQALWKAGFDELLEAGRIASYGSDNEIYQVTREGYKVGDML